MMFRPYLLVAVLVAGAQAPTPTQPLDTSSAAAALVARLQQNYERDPATAVPLARLLSAMALADRKAEQLLIAWVHQQLALDYVPATSNRAKTPAHAALLDALADGHGDDSLPDATAALRMWAKAQQTTGARRLRVLAAENFPSPGISYAPRYQLLFAEYLERQQLEGDGRALRAHVIDQVSEALDKGSDWSGPQAAYWLAYALSRETALLSRELESAPRGPKQFALVSKISRNLQTASAMTLQAGALMPLDGPVRRLRLDPDAPDRDQIAWFVEQMALGGPTEFVTPWIADLERRASQLEQRGDRDGAAMQRARLWGPKLALARADPAKLAALEAEWRTANPGASFNASFAQMVIDLGRAGPLPADPFMTLTGRWRLLYVMTSDCAACAGDFVALNTLAREFPDSVVALVPGAFTEAAMRQYMTSHGLIFQAALTTPAAVAALGVTALSALPTRFIVSPERRPARLPAATWQADARRILSLNK